MAVKKLRSHALWLRQVIIKQKDKFEFRIHERSISRLIVNLFGILSAPSAFFLAFDLQLGMCKFLVAAS